MRMKSCPSVTVSRRSAHAPSIVVALPNKIYPAISSRYNPYQRHEFKSKATARPSELNMLPAVAGVAGLCIAAGAEPWTIAILSVFVTNLGYRYIMSEDQSFEQVFRDHWVNDHETKIELLKAQEHLKSQLKQSQRQVRLLPAEERVWSVSRDNIQLVLYYRYSACSSTKQINSSYAWHPCDTAVSSQHIYPVYTLTVIPYRYLFSRSS